MRLSRPVLLAGAIGVLAVSGLVAPLGAHTTKETAATRKARIARGKYLVTIGGCNDCHTPGTFYGKPDMSRVLSGSELGWQGPWGVSYAANLTSDRTTGIGTWTEKQIVTAITHGQDPEGKVILPPMPWPALAHLTAADAAAIAAYLKSIPAVKHKVPDAVPPGTTATGSIVVIPPPSEWDAPRE